jgi:hypothetical protein
MFPHSHLNLSFNWKSYLYACRVNTGHLAETDMDLQNIILKIYFVVVGEGAKVKLSL